MNQYTSRSNKKHSLFVLLMICLFMMFCMQVYAAEEARDATGYPAVIKMEAEDAVLSSPAAVAIREDASGGKKVG